MKLTDLEPEWLHDSVLHPDVLTIENAQGVMFACPTCFKKNGGLVGTESILCWFRGRGVPDDKFPGPGRWTPSGTSFEDLTLTPSVNVANEHWHGWVQNGQIVGGI